MELTYKNESEVEKTLKKEGYLAVFMGKDNKGLDLVLEKYNGKGAYIRTSENEEYTGPGIIEYSRTNNPETVFLLGEYPEGNQLTEIKIRDITGLFLKN